MFVTILVALILILDAKIPICATSISVMKWKAYLNHEMYTIVIPQDPHAVGYISFPERLYTYIYTYIDKSLRKPHEHGM